MAGEVQANISRSSFVSKSTEIADLEPPDTTKNCPKFLSDEAEFVGRGDIKPSSRNLKHRRSRSRSGTRITPANLSVSDEHFYEDLEEYVKEMSTVRDKDVTMAGPGEPDVWSQLQQKESDLLLAAELGKALLDKNKELTKEQERLAEEHAKKIEVSLQTFWSVYATVRVEISLLFLFASEAVGRFLFLHVVVFFLLSSLLN